MSSVHRAQIEVRGTLAGQTLEAREIALCDREGRRRASLQVRDDGVVALMLLDAAGHARVEIEVDADGQTRLTHRDAHGNATPLPKATPPPVAPAIRGPLAREVTPLPEDVIGGPAPGPPAPREAAPPVEKPFRGFDSILP